MQEKKYYIECTPDFAIDFALAGFRRISVNFLKSIFDIDYCVNEWYYKQNDGVERCCFFLDDVNKYEKIIDTFDEWIVNESHHLKYNNEISLVETHRDFFYDINYPEGGSTYSITEKSYDLVNKFKEVFSVKIKEFPLKIDVSILEILHDAEDFLSLPKLKLNEIEGIDIEKYLEPKENKENVFIQTDIMHPIFKRTCFKRVEDKNNIILSCNDRYYFDLYLGGIEDMLKIENPQNLFLRVKYFGLLNEQLYAHVEKIIGSDCELLKLPKFKIIDKN